jgi:WD40 repeat protein
MGVERCTMQGHLVSVNAVAFSPDGQTVASGSGDHSVRLWDPAEVDKHQLDVVVKTLSFSSNGLLATDRGSLSLNYQPLTSFTKRQENGITWVPAQPFPAIIAHGHGTSVSIIQGATHSPLIKYHAI